MQVLNHLSCPSDRPDSNGVAVHCELLASIQFACD